MEKQPSALCPCGQLMSVHADRANEVCCRDAGGQNTSTASSEQVPLPEGSEEEPTDFVSHVVGSQ